MDLKALYLDVSAHIDQLSELTIKNSSGNVIATETARDGNIVKFTSFDGAARVAAGTSKAFDVYGTIAAVNTAADAGAFTISIAAAYDDADYTDDADGFRILSVNAGSYLVA